MVGLGQCEQCKRITITLALACSVNTSVEIPSFGIYLKVIMNHFHVMYIYLWEYFNFLLFRSRRDDIEDEDDQETFFRVMKEVPLEYYPDDDEEIDYDSDGNPIAPPRSKVHNASL